jgi:hypothetical protein
LTYRGIITIAQAGDCDCHAKEECHEYEQAIVVALFAVFILFHPRLIPSMYEIDQKYELHNYEHETTDDTNIHENLFECARLNVKCANAYANHSQVFEEPEAVLNHGPWVSRTSHSNHDYGK